VYVANDKVRTLSAFGDARVQLSAQWDVLAGIRVEREAQKRDLSGTFLGTLPAEIKFDEKVTEVLPKVGIDFHFDQDRSLGAVVYSGYQAPGVGVDFLGSGGAYTYGKEKSKTAELVWRSQWLSRTVTFNANIFQTNYRDYQLFGTDVGGGFIIKNAKKATIRGLELEANWQPSKGTSVFAQLGLLRARLDKFDDTENSFVNGGALPEAPRHTFRIGGSVTPFEGVSLGADVYRSSSYYSDVENIEAVLVPAYTVFNLNASWKLQSFTLNAFVNNVGNRFYVTGKLYPDAFKPRAYAAPPRTIGLSATYKF
jgi:iron complex outermembrane recepter protein